MSGEQQKTRVVRIPYDPQPYQLESHNDPSRFKVIIRGRRGGKTEEEIQGAIRDAVTNPGLHWITGPFFNQIKSIAWVRLKAILNACGDKGWKINEAELYVEHTQIRDEKGVPTRIELKGVDKEDRLVGVGLRSLRCDEAALYRPHVWPLVLRPMLMDHNAPAWFYTTPRGKNWLYDLYMKGMDPNEPDWKSWRQPTEVNKYIHESEIEEMRRDMPERLFLQEVMAQFLDDTSGVFRGIRRCTVGELKDPIPGRLYVMGVDLAKSVDFTVITVIDTVTREVVYFERFQNIDWGEQKIRIQDAAKLYNNAIVHMDSTGVGDPIYDDLNAAGVAVEGYKFNNTSKCALIKQLIIAIEGRLVTWPRELEVLTQEVSDYDYKISESGNIIYNAPEGKHDDCVISLALAVWFIRSQLREAQKVMVEVEQDTADKHQGGELIWAANQELQPVEHYDDPIGGY